MNRGLSITTITRNACVGLLLLSPMALAHGGFDHVKGTVEKVAGNTLTVKTDKGDVDVKLNEKTELTKDNHKAVVSDLEPGARVIVDIPEGNKEHLAHSVKIGAATASEHSH